MDQKTVWLSIQRIGVSLLAATLIGMGTAAGTAAETGPIRPRVIEDQKWCRALLPGKRMTVARKRCVDGLENLSAYSLGNAIGLGDIGSPNKPKGLYAIPASLISALAWNDVATVGVEDYKPYVVWEDSLPRPTPQPTPQPTPRRPFQDGTWMVGSDIQPGTYRASGVAGRSCYWERLSGFSGSDDILDNGLDDPPVIVTIKRSDSGFRSANCGTWSPA